VFHRLSSPTDSWNGRGRLVVRVIEEPSTGGLPSTLDEVQSIPDAHVWMNTVVPRVVERTEDVIVVTGRERELQERRVRDLAGREPSEESALEQVPLASRLAAATSGSSNPPARRS
jgi:hypothetical protein